MKIVRAQTAASPFRHWDQSSEWEKPNPIPILLDKNSSADSHCLTECYKDSRTDFAAREQQIYTSSVVSGFRNMLPQTERSKQGLKTSVFGLNESTDVDIAR